MIKRRGLLALIGGSRHFSGREKDSPLLFREFDSRVPVSRIKDAKHRSFTGRRIS